MGRRKGGRLGGVGFTVLSTVVAGCGASGSGDDALSDLRTDDPALVDEALSPGDLVFLLPEYLPDGWSMGHATQRIDTVEWGGEGQWLEVSDYTVVWRPTALAGSTHGASTSVSQGPSISINSGSMYWLMVARWEPFPELDDAEFTDDDGYLSVDFRLDCCGVTLGGRGVDEDELRQVAESISATDLSTWRATLGDRLLIDDHRHE